MSAIKKQGPAFYADAVAVILGIAGTIVMSVCHTMDTANPLNAFGKLIAFAVLAMVLVCASIAAANRKKDVVISGGENIYPVQIEDFLSANPAVKDVAVIGLPDERLGEICAAIIELKPEYADTTVEDINEYCLDLPRYKRPRKIIFADVPRNPTGKIEKPVLRQRYGAEQLVDRENHA